MNFLKCLCLMFKSNGGGSWAEQNKPDWVFIRELEGFLSTGYVPKDPDKNDNSGVTIGAGFDLGQQGITGLRGMGLSQGLCEKLQPYLGLQGYKARNFIKAHPLKLGAAELTELDEKVKASYFSKIEREYNDASDYTFSFLPSEVQTVILSVGFQYGSLKRVPKFKEYAIKGMWKSLANELENFGDAYPKRRCREAAYLRAYLEKGKGD